MRIVRFSLGSLVGAILALLLLGTRPSVATPIIQPDYDLQPLRPLTSPDLVIDNVAFSPVHPGISETVQITVTFSNQGDVTAAGFYVYLFVDPVDRPPVVTTTYTSRLGWFVPLDPGVAQQWTRTQTFSAEGNHVIYAWIDRDDSVVESNETNNLLGPISIPVGNVGDLFEDDNTCAQANLISTDGATQLHNLNTAPDQDWVKFEGLSGVTYRIQGNPIGPDADLAVEIHNACDSQPTFGGGTEFDYTVPADGTYYLKFEHVQVIYGPNNAYQIKVTAQNAACSGSSEPNNQCAAAADIAANGSAQQHTLCQPNDVDWTRFTTAAGATYLISATNIGPNANVELGLYPTCDSSGSFGTSQQIQFTAATTGTVYVKAQNADPALAGPDTEYRLQVTQLANDCQPDPYEEDDIVGNARLLTTNSVTQTHNTCPAGDQDWYQFQAIAGVSYTLETLNLGLKADTVMCLYDQAGISQLQCDDDSGAGHGSRLFWIAPSNGAYKLRVVDWDSSVAGPDTRYDIRVFAGQCLPDTLEQDNSRNTAHPINASGALQSHNVCPNADEDWAAFSANSTAYVIETTDLGPEADTVLELYDSNGVRLAENDDYSASAASRIFYTVTTPGQYFVRVQHYSPNRMGAGTDYSLRVQAGTPAPPTPTPTPQPTITPTPPPQMSGVKTMILVNRERIATQYGEAAATQLLSKLSTLAAHPQVKGEVIRLDQNTTVSNTYTAWTTDLTNVTKANQVAAAIRGLVLAYWQEHVGVKYIVLVGADQVIPFRRIVDNTPRNDYLEDDYLLVNATHPTGAALRNNYYLTDDYYADREPTAFSGREVYLPDLAIGRLIETPDEVGAVIDAFLTGPYTLTVSNTLVTGYDFFQDSASAMCSTWQSDLGPAGNVDCSLIGDNWLLNDYRAKQLTANPPFTLQAINGHANHYQEGAPGFGGSINATDIASATANLARGLLYTIGCHSGLNVPPANSTGPLDLAQAFSRKQMNYVGNTGYGWGVRGGIGLSERLMQIYTDELRRGVSASMGEALAAAKRRYFQEEQQLDGYDEKVLEESVFYGLPMYLVQTGDQGATGDEFPSVEGISVPAPLGDESGPFDIQLIGSLSASDVMSETVTTEGAYYALDGSTYVSPGEPIQPRFHLNVTAAMTDTARSVLFYGGRYETIPNFDPVVATSYNEYVTDTTESELGFTQGWYPPLPVGLQINEHIARLVTQLGQYDPATHQERLYREQQVSVYYSSSLDRTPPTITVIQARANVATHMIAAKIGAEDPSGVGRVLVTYQTDLGQGQGQWQSVDLTFNSATQKWTGTFPGNGNTRYFVQAVDNAGNLTAETNKGSYYLPDVFARYMVYLPLTMK